MIDKNKKNDIKELINVYALNQSQLKEIIPTFVNTAILTEESDDSRDEVTNAVIQQIIKSSFAEKYAASFDDEFTHDEIKFLLDSYKSKTMKKFLKNKKLFGTIFKEFNTIILEVLDERKKTRI